MSTYNLTLRVDVDGWLEKNECISHNFILFAVFVPETIVVGGNLMKFCQTQVCAVLRVSVYMRCREYLYRMTRAFSTRYTRLTSAVSTRASVSTRTVGRDSACTGVIDDVTVSRHHRSIYKYLDTGLRSLSLAIGDPFKLTSHAQHASRWRMCGSQTCRLLHRPRGLARMRHRENRQDREFMLGNSRMKLPDAMHAG